MKPIFWRNRNPSHTSRRLTGMPLAVEITILLIVKVALITLLAKTFFAHPEARHMRMPTTSVEQRMLAGTSTETVPVAHRTPETISTPE